MQNSLDNAIFRRATPDDAEAVWRLYRELVGTEYCPWDDNYPARGNIDDDISAEALYVLDGGDCGLLAAGTVRRCAEHDPLAPWRSPNPCDLMRFGVARGRHGCGIGREMLRRLCAEAEQRGYGGMRILVAETNLPARKLYRSAGARERGRACTYGIHWECLELPWSPR